MNRIRFRKLMIIIGFYKFIFLKKETTFLIYREENFNNLLNITIKYI